VPPNSLILERCVTVGDHLPCGWFLWQRLLEMFRQRDGTSKGGPAQLSSSGRSQPGGSVPVDKPGWMLRGMGVPHTSSPRDCPVIEHILNGNEVSGASVHAMLKRKVRPRVSRTSVSRDLWASWYAAMTLFRFGIDPGCHAQDFHHHGHPHHQRSS
jgi:hypothetical protein